MMRSAAERVRRFLDQFSSDDHVLIVINADPDAIASAMAAKRLLWRTAASVSISNINIVKRPDNTAMIRLLGVNLIHINDVAWSKYNRFIIVDSQPEHHEAFSRFSPDVIIDHHPDTGYQAPFRDIRPNYGATASIMTEYLRADKIKPSAKLATGLFHAIKTDTHNFEGQTLSQDLDAFQFLFRHANVHLARKIEQSELRIDFLKYYRSALNDMRLRRNRVFVHLGPVVNPDVCVLIADFFMRVNPVQWSIVSGQFNDRLIIVFRNDGIRKNAGNVAHQTFGHIGSAGGHKSMARAEIAMSDLPSALDDCDDKALSNWIIKQIEKKAEK
ncbi:MAG: DHH family phosphoesterase [Desulfobacterales bacterium]